MDWQPRISLKHAALQNCSQIVALLLTLRPHSNTKVVLLSFFYHYIIPMPPFHVAECGSRYFTQKVLAVELTSMKKGAMCYYAKVPVHGTQNYTSVCVSEGNSTPLWNPVVFFLNSREGVHRLDFRLLPRKKKRHFLSSLIPLRADIAADHPFFPVFQKLVCSLVGMACEIL